MSVRHVLPFGKHQGRAISDVESGYLVWLVENSDHLAPTLKRAIFEELRGRYTGELARLDADDLPADTCPKCGSAGFVEHDPATHTSQCSVCANTWTPGRIAR